MGVGEVLTAPQSPWQNSFAERLIGSIRRECLDHVLVLGERHLRRTLARYFAYYHRARTHLSLDKDAPHGRPIERPELGRVIPSRSAGRRGRPHERGRETGRTSRRPVKPLIFSLTGDGYGCLRPNMLQGQEST